MQRLIAIFGPTSSGKSAVALALADELGGEIISCDSVQVYRGFDIGTAKPTPAERAKTPHHLIDVAAWDEPFDAQRFRELALASIVDIRARGRVPILVGGTGLYLRALRYGLVDLPRADPAVRARLLAEEASAPGSLYARLRREDPESARTIEPNNLVYVARALEIQETTGEPASRVRQRHGFQEESVPLNLIGLDWPPDLLRERIAARTQQMLARGLLDEVHGLLAQGVTPESRPMSAVGYREACEVALGKAAALGLIERIIKSTSAYARRQRTWMRREEGVQAILATSEAEATDRARALLRPPSSAIP